MANKAENLVAHFRDYLYHRNHQAFDLGCRALREFIIKSLRQPKYKLIAEDIAQEVATELLGDGNSSASSHIPAHRHISVGAKLFLLIEMGKSDQYIGEYIELTIRSKKRKCVDESGSCYYSFLQAVRGRLNKLAETRVLEKHGRSGFSLRGQPIVAVPREVGLKRARDCRIKVVGIEMPNGKNRTSYRGLTNAITTLVTDPENAGHLWTAHEITDILNRMHQGVFVPIVRSVHSETDHDEGEIFSIDLPDKSPGPGAVVPDNPDYDERIEAWASAKVARLKREDLAEEMVHVGFLQICFRSPNDLAPGLGMPETLIAYMKGGDSYEKIGAVLNQSKGKVSYMVEFWETFCQDSLDDIEELHFNKGRAFLMLLELLLQEFGLPALGGTLP